MKISILKVALIAILLLFTFTQSRRVKKIKKAKTPVSFYNGKDQAFNTNQNWMKKIPDATLVSKISIPGTHDSATKDFSGHAQCQVLSIANQLTIGVRYFDLRFGTSYLTFNKDQNAEHGKFHSKYSLKQIFTEIKTFLSQNPTEGVIAKLVVKTEKVKEEALSEFNDIILYQTAVPTMQQLRGKVWILLKLKNKHDASDTLNYTAIAKKYVQAAYKDCPNKKTNSLNHAKQAAAFLSSNDTKSNLFINQISCSPIATSVTNLFKTPIDAAKKNNDVIFEFPSGFIGIVVMDYISTDDTQFIISRN